MDTEITLKSGAMLELKPASFEAASDLFDELLKEAASSNLDLNNLTETAIVLFILKAVSSKSVKAEVFKCARKSLYNGQSIQRHTFEPEEARGDYLTVIGEVAVFSVLPFIKGTDLSLLTKNIKIPKSLP